ncbi:Potassium transporter 4 [Glycine max]|nr:Potassium transporter 4 [Glycine max]
MHADIVSRKHPSEINTWCCILHEISEIEGNEWNERERERGICFLSFTFSLSQMELESGVSTSQKNPAKLSWVNLSKYLLLAYQSFGVVYGDLSTSPLYVYTSTLSGKLQNHRHEEVIFGIFSLIFWTLTLIPLLKYAVIILNVDDNGEGEVVLIACVILVGLFALQRYGTHKVVFVFAPVVIIWLVSIFSIGLYNIIRWNPKKFCAISPNYLIKFFIKTGKEGWISLGGMLLCITGTEAMFADIGHFTTVSIRLAFSFVIYPCLVVQYMDQAAFLSKNLNSVHNSFYDSTGHNLNWKCLWPCLYDGYVCDYISDGTSHNVCLAEKHSDSYNIPFVLLGDRGCISICSIGKSVSRRMGSSCLIFHLYACNVCVALWHLYQVQLRPMQQSFIEMVTGFGPYSLIYTELATGIPAIFSHFVTKLPAFHMVLFFVCVKTVPVPHVSHEERYLIWRVCPRPCQMYRCTVRYGYKHIRRDDRDFDNHIIRCIAEFIQMEAQELQLSFSETSSFDGGTAIISVRSLESVSSRKVSENEDVGVDKNNASGRSFSVRRPLSTYNEENPHSRRRHISFRVPNDPVLDHEVKQELLDLAQTMEAGVQLWLLTFLTSVSLKLE